MTGSADCAVRGWQLGQESWAGKRARWSEHLGLAALGTSLDCQLLKLSFLSSEDQQFYLLFGSTAFLWHTNV